ncbi:MAG: hypothetical protein ABR538_17345 [Candidatus Binatia bacterium]
MLADDAIERYARQIVVPGIGAAGQERLLAATALVVGHERGCRQAALYLEAAGVRVLREAACAEGAKPDLVVVADAGVLDEGTRAALLRAASPLCWYATGPDGFSSGVHPASPLPSPASASGEPDDALHDAAACDAASVACAILLGLPCREGVVRFDVLSS